MAGVITINGIARDVQNGWSLRMAANARAQLSCEVLSINAAYRPTLDHVVTLTDNGTLIFGGFVSSAPEKGVGSESWLDIITDVTATDYNSIAERRYINATIPTGNLKSVLTAIVALLGDVTLHASQVNGPTIPDLVYSDVRLDSVLNDLTAMSGGWPWAIDENKALRMRDPAVVAAPFNIVASSGSTLSAAVGDVEVEPSMEGYANSVVVKSANFRKTAVDAAGVAAHGVWQVVYTAPDDTAEAAMQALADSILARSLPLYKKVMYKTLTPGLRPGMAQTITLPRRNVNNTFLIMEVNLMQAEDGIHYYHVTAIEGTVYQLDWREMYRKWSGTASGSVSGGVTTGGGGVPAFTKRVYDVGGSELTAVQSPTPTWVSASMGGIRAQIDTTDIGTTTVTIKARLRALTVAVTVQARLFDITANAPCAGLSAVVTNTDWEQVTWSVTLTAGAHFYELQLLPGSANEDVQGTGYVEN